ncbi:hypothetical protein AA313_de0203805 [Arthrobotrys entomopaga]|nr:hypothetical protein AA313_de0203805 [Arthrobotrys entomopaga]
MQDEFKNPTPFDTRPKEVCRKKFFLENLPFISDGRVVKCHNEARKVEFVTWAEYDHAVKNLIGRISISVDIIDHWVCNSRLSPKSMTYFTLFKRTVADSRVIPDAFNGPQAVAHFGDYPALLEETLKVVRPLGPDIQAMIDDLKTKFPATKKLMESISKSKKGFPGISKKRCPAVKKLPDTKHLLHPDGEGEDAGEDPGFIKFKKEPPELDL